jgi:hypothetical protein
MATITDDFNRASLGANWTTLTAYTSLAISGSTILIPNGTFADFGNKYTASTVDTGDQYAQVAVTINTANANNSAWCLFRAVSGATVSGYFVAMPRFGGTRQLSKVVANTPTVLASESDGSWTGTRTMRGEALGSRISMWIDGVEKLSLTDTSFDNTNKHGGLVAYHEAAGRVSLDNFEMGDLTAPTDPWVAISTTATLTASRSPAITFAESPVEDDIIVIWVASTTASAITDPSGWTNLLGANTDVESDSHQLCAYYHVVTAAEDSANTVTWTLTNMYDATETGAVVAVVVRNGDPADPLGGTPTSTFDSANTVTPAVLAQVTPDVTGGLVLSAVVQDSTASYTVPTGWSLKAYHNVNVGIAAFGYGTLTTASSAVGPTNVTPDAGDEYASISLVIKSGTAAPNEGAATGAIGWAGSATGARTSSGAATGAIGWVGSATGTRVSSGAATGAIAWVGSATGEAPVVVQTGEAIGTVDWVGSATGTTQRSGASSGAIDWVGTATGTNVHSGSATGTITWAGSATGAATHQGAGAGAVAWVGSATGEAPTVGVNDGAANGAIDWAGAAAGTRTSSGAATGSVTWAGSTTGTRTPQGAATGSITWAGTATGETPAVGVNDGSATGAITWAGTATGVSAYQGSATGSITWAGAATGVISASGAAVGTITWAGVASGAPRGTPTMLRVFHVARERRVLIVPPTPTPSISAETRVLEVTQ